jgi:transcriptional regulator with XRE-family HTH domain
MVAGMTQTIGTAPPVGLSAYVAGEIRAYLGRHSISKSELGRRVGKDDTWIGKRLNGRTDISLTDVEIIAAACGVAPATFLPRESGDTRRYPVDPLAPRIVKKVDDQSQTVRKPTNRRADRPHSRRDMAEVRRAPATRVAR